MAFTLTFPSRGPQPSPDELAEWISEHGEPWEHDGPRLSLRALPLVLTPGPFGLEARVSPGRDTPLTRLVGLVFDLSVRVGGDVHLVGAGTATKHQLWLHLADEQDRARIADALDRAGGRVDEVTRGLWCLLGATGRGEQLRWDTGRRCIVEIPDPDDDEPTLPEAEAVPTVAVAPGAGIYLLAWRWLKDAWPSLVERA